MPHQPEGQTEHLPAKVKDIDPATQHNPDPDSNSGYPAGGNKTAPDRDAYGRPVSPDKAPDLA
ncbi:hypothetical protein CEG14_14000 [Bordetella genomosp. 1]|uniref:Uncharacterized protein n=1 Tax=Bordetella genomosp. 1 TaxID=1395607 RepID=A0A261SFF5_9BORD|nr:hypothetical protein [Bordetella genomosp. 1]MDQ8035251.1 hypothetical protein [Bordetella sp.]OZI36139.1 hypothetical protein CEG14_14000 [Bordetella genomosp. 1]OZI58835.1 hypothetical protein CAL27_19365 [Bordetella genomosp. 1]